MEMLVQRIVMVLLALFGLAAAPASAETLYKLVAPDGKVTYVQEPPKDYRGKVIKLDIDTNANTAEGRRGRGAESNEAVIRANPDASRMEKLKAAQEKVEAARKAYEQARDNPREEDVQRVGNLKGGARPVFSEDYQRKLERLEQDVKAAQEELDKLERGR